MDALATIKFFAYYRMICPICVDTDCDAISFQDIINCVSLTHKIKVSHSTPYARADNPVICRDGIHVYRIVLTEV